MTLVTAYVLLRGIAEVKRELITSLVSPDIFLVGYCDVGRGQVKGGTVKVLSSIAGHHWYCISIVFPLKVVLGTSNCRTRPLCGTIDTAIRSKGDDSLVLLHNRYNWENCGEKEADECNVNHKSQGPVPRPSQLEAVRTG